MFAHSAAEADLARERCHAMTGQWMPRVEFAHVAEFLTWAKTGGEYMLFPEGPAGGSADPPCGCDSLFDEKL